MADKSDFALTEKPPVGIEDRVVKVVKNWANMPSDPKDDDSLKVLWDKFGRDIPFQPDKTSTVGATSNLVENLKNEFKNPPARNIDIEPSDMDPGNIKTVANLVTAVIQSS